LIEGVEKEMDEKEFAEVKLLSSQQPKAV